MSRVILVFMALMICLYTVSIQAEPSVTRQPTAPQTTKQANENLQALLKQALELKEKHPKRFNGAKGILVTKVLADSQGAKAGLKPGDILIRYDSILLNNTEQLIRLTGERSAEQAVKLGCLADGELYEVLIHGGRIGVVIQNLIKQREETPVDRMVQLNKRSQQALATAQYQKALAFYEEGLAIARKEEYKQGIRAFLTNIGIVYQNLGQYPKALDYYEQALVIQPEIGDGHGEGNTLTNIGNVYQSLGQYPKALDYYEQALVIHRETGDRRGEGADLSNIGVVYSGLGQYPKALEYYEQALVIHREIGSEYGEGDILTNIGALYSNLGKNPKALDYFEQALVIHRETGDRGGEGADLGNIGTVYDDLGQYFKALQYYEQALVIRRDIGDRNGEGSNLGNIGGVYGKLGQYLKALDYFEQGLVIRRDIGDQVGEGMDLGNIGAVYSNLGQYPKALDYYEKALVIRRDIGHRLGEGMGLSNIGEVYGRLGQYPKALEYYKQALVLRRDIGDRNGEGNDLNDIGTVYANLRQYPKALDYYEQALAIQITVGAPESLWRVWANMRRSLAKLDQSLAAILAGKQAVNIIQSMRASNIRLEKGQQQSFLGGKKHVYQGLADLLIEQGRIPEAEQVLAMLKEEEYFDFIRRDDESDTRSTRASHTPAEQTWLQNYQRFSDQLVTLGREYTALEQRKQLSDVEQQRLAQLESELDVAQEAFLEVVSSLGNYFKRVSSDKALDHGKRQLDLLENQQERLTELRHGAVLIHTVTTEDKLHLLLTTPNSQLARLSPIGETELNSLIQRFREVLQSPNADPLPLAQQLYNHLVKPLEKDLQQAGAETLMWSLDGALRYIPLAALHDGEHYLLERYPMVLYTAAAGDNLMRDNNDAWRLAGLGVSKQYPGFSALDAVPGELNGIIREDDQDTDGVIPGRVYLNGAFDKARFKQVLRGDYQVLHIASHFRLQPGDSQASHLLLGDGDILSLEDFRKKRAYKMRNVDLLTLSACNTAMGDNGNGGEVESFGVLAQKRGAGGVLATLWSVADESTGLFMQHLYRLRSDDNEMTKAEALRQAQMAMLRGQLRGEGSIGRGFSRDEPVDKVAASSGYSHPFYWAPFILMGNWL